MVGMWCGRQRLVGFLSVERGRYGELLTFWWHLLPPYFPTLIVLAAAEGVESMCHYHQTSCDIITLTWAGASLVTVAGDVALQHRFVMAGVICLCPYGCGWLEEGHRRWWLSVAVVMQRWVDHCAQEQKCLFVHDVHVSFWQTLLM